MAVTTGRTRPYDLEITGSDGSTVYPLKVLYSRGTPVWTVERAPDIEGEVGGVQFKERAYRSGHLGYGWGQAYVQDVYHYAENMDLRFPQQAIIGPLVTSVALSSTNTTTGVTGFFEHGSSLYTISGKYVNKINPSTDAVASSGGFPHDLTTGNAGAVGTVGMRFDGNVVIGVTTASTAYMVSFDGTSTFTVLTNAPKGAYMAKWWADTDEVLAVAFLYNATTPAVAWIATGAALNTAANWTGLANGDYPVGDTAYSVTGMVANDTTMFVAKTDGLRFVEGYTGRSPNKIPAFPIESTNGTGTYIDSMERVWFPCRSGLYRYDPNTGVIEDVTPGRGLPDRSPIRGQVTALIQFRAWTYASVYDGKDSYIVAGRDREPGEPGYGPVIWHGSLAKFSNTKVTSMHLSGLTTPARLWFGLLSGNTAYIRLPQNGDNPLDDPTYRYAASGSVYFPADDYGSPGMRWNLQSVAVEIEGGAGNDAVAVYERRDMGSATRQVETATVVGTIGIAGAGNATVIVTSANMSNSPKTVSVAVANEDTASQVATKIRNALNADADVGKYFVATGSVANLVLTSINPAANDTTLNISIDNGTCSGLTAAPTSTNTTAGVSGWTSLQTVTANGRTVINTTGDKRFNRSELRADVTNDTATTWGASISTLILRGMTGKAARRPTNANVILTTVYCDDEALSRLGVPVRIPADTILTQLDNLDNYAPTTLLSYWTGRVTSNTVLVSKVGPKRVIRQEKDDPAVYVVDLVLRIIS